MLAQRVQFVPAAAIGAASYRRIGKTNVNHVRLSICKPGKSEQQPRSSSMRAEVRYGLSNWGTVSCFRSCGRLFLQQRAASLVDIMRCTARL